MLTQGIEVQKYIRASAGRAGLSVVFEDCNQPRHDGKTIFLPKITAKTSERDLKQLMASTDHEVAHDRYSSFEVLKKLCLDPNGILMFTWNFLEDSRVNNIEAREYQGFRENWDDCSGELVEQILKKSEKADSMISKIMAAMLIWESKISKGVFPNIEFVASKFSCSEDILDVLSNYSDRLVACHFILDKEKGTEATYQLAYDILNKLGTDCKKELEEALAKAATKASEKKSGKKEAGKGEASKASGTPDDTDGAEKGGEGEKSDEFKIIKVTLTKDDLKTFSLTSPDEGSEMGNIGLNFDPVDLDNDVWDLTDYEKFVVVHYPKGVGNPKYLLDEPKFVSVYKSCVEPLLISQENFAQQVRRIIQIRAKVQTQYGVKKGKLDQSRLSRICFNAPGFNEKVFKNRIENKTLDAAVSVLVDMSGSMGGDKAYYALASALLLNEVCSTLNIPLEVTGFSDDYNLSYTVAPSMFVYKAFTDLKVSHEDMIKYFSQSSRHMNGNPDGENIIWAHDRLIKRKEKKKLLVVMSDGCPAASKSSEGIEGFTLKVIREIENSKRVDIYGLGLCSNSVRDYYRAHSIVNAPQDIPHKLLELIEKRILT